MKYEFHVGDYVETRCNHIGYISKIEPISNGHTALCVHCTDGKIYPYDVDDIYVKLIFNRIGQYDFTKPEQPKEIKKLQDGYGDGFVLYKGMTAVDGSVDDGWVSIGVLSSKINELVDAVNELRNK